jgi:hypothetical protein
MLIFFGHLHKFLLAWVLNECKQIVHSPPSELKKNKTFKKEGEVFRVDLVCFSYFMETGIHFPLWFLLV